MSFCTKDGLCNLLCAHGASHSNSGTAEFVEPPGLLGKCCRFDFAISEPCLFHGCKFSQNAFCERSRCPSLMSGFLSGSVLADSFSLPFASSCYRGHGFVCARLHTHSPYSLAAMLPLAGSVKEANSKITEIEKLCGSAVARWLWTLRAYKKTNILYMVSCTAKLCRCSPDQSLPRFAGRPPGIVPSAVGHAAALVKHVGFGLQG